MNYLAMRHIIVSFPIQSASDIITNSSSEIFCYIKGDHLSAIYDLLMGLFGGGEHEISPVVELDEKDCISIYLPYSHIDQSSFYEAGLTAILDKHFKDLYTIEFE